MKIIILDLILVAMIVFFGYLIYHKLMASLEEAYFEGQKDAFNRDIRIKQNQDGCFFWTKSPWNDDSDPIFNPSNICRK